MAVRFQPVEIVVDQRGDFFGILAVGSSEVAGKDHGFDGNGTDRPVLPLVDCQDLSAFIVNSIFDD